MAQGFSLKDQLFNADTVGALGASFEAAGVFAAQPFVGEVMDRLPPLELKARIAMIAEVLARHLPPDFPAAAAAIRAALPPPLDPTRGDGDFGQFIHAPLGVYVETHGIDDHLDLSLDLLEEITQRFSMEYSIRAFLNRWPDATLARMERWARHPHYHVRRLVSEGTRPRLPWGKGIAIGPDRTLPLLDLLYADPTRFVTRSVANHLNDIAKTDPDAVLDRLRRWQEEGRQNPAELDWMTRHALRTLVKAGHPGALSHLGFATGTPRAATVSIAPAAPVIGTTAEVTARIVPDADGPLLIDYVIDFVKKSGKTAPRVFKWTKAEGEAGRAIDLRKSHRFVKGATTFTHYPGDHRLRLQVNGRIVAETRFALS